MDWDNYGSSPSFHLSSPLLEEARQDSPVSNSPSPLFNTANEVFEEVDTKMLYARNKIKDPNET